MDAIPPVVGNVALSATASTALVFVSDRDSEGVIRQCLNDLSVAAPEFRNGGVDEAIATLTTRHSPRLLIVDVQGVNDPVAKIRELGNVCDPTTDVIVIGPTNDIRLYQELKASGIVEYYFKPLVRGLVMQSCNAVLTGSAARPLTRTGKLIVVLGVRGGVGATMIGVTMALNLAETHKRRVGLVDLDLQFGDAALQLDVAPSHALREALDTPDRVDELFLDRGMAKVGERLGVFAALESLSESVVPAEAGVMALTERLLHRCRYVILDFPLSAVPRLMPILHIPGTVLLVSSGSLVCARDVVRLKEKIGPNTAERTTIHIMNKSGAADSLSVEDFTAATGAPPDVVIAYDRGIAVASRLGVQGLQKCAPLQRGLLPLFRQLSGESPTLVTKPPFWRRLIGKAT
jgi:pilus assembly protein CpaE